MHGPVQRLIQSQGAEYTVRNASGGGGRDTPTYSDDGSLVAVIERRGLARTVTGSDGSDVAADLELRAVVDDTTTIREAGSSSGYPTKLVSSTTSVVYRVVDSYLEDGGVTVLTVVED